MGEFVNFGWAKNPDYIVNLTRNIIGEELFKTAKKGGCELLLSLAYAKAWEKVRQMTPETLGCIVAYGTPEGFHHNGPLADVPGFINLTGTIDVCESLVDVRSMNCIEVLRVLAMNVVVCVTIDIVRQDEYAARRSEEQKLEDQLERAEHRMTHPDR